jgi:hypothetical protein
VRNRPPDLREIVVETREKRCDLLALVFNLARSSLAAVCGRDFVAIRNVELSLRLVGLRRDPTVSYVRAICAPDRVLPRPCATAEIEDKARDAAIRVPARQIRVSETF